jgi:hypothetical protein
VGILHPRTHGLLTHLPFVAIAVAWLGLGLLVDGLVRLRRPVAFETLVRVFVIAKPTVPMLAHDLGLSSEG